MDLEITKKQFEFIKSIATETLFGGAAGGGKSYGQIIDAFLFAMKYPKSKQLILRRTFPELEKSIVRTALEIYPQRIATYNSSNHTWTFVNGSLIDFGYCDGEKDVYKYQSAEYDVIRFDELTHFTEQMYLYLISRCRGANGFPKYIKSSTNPGGIGHTWVKSRFIDIGAFETIHNTANGTRVFIPSKVQDNKFLLDSDPNYIKRLENLAEKDKKALLHGNWDIFDGQYFTEWNREIHVVKPFQIPSHWRIYFTMDYGRDMAAFYFIAVDDQGNAYVIKEHCQGLDNDMEPLGVSDACELIKEYSEDLQVHMYLAPHDMWNSDIKSGKSVAEMFAKNGIQLYRTSKDRVAGWTAIREYLKPYTDIDGAIKAKLRIFENCTNLIRCLPQLQYDSKNPNDVANNPHNITHSPDALRGFCVYRTHPNKTRENPQVSTLPTFFKDKPKPHALGKGDKVHVI